MLIKLLPDQISKNWEKLKTAVLNALPPIAPYLGTDTEINLLQALVNDKLQMWAVCRDRNGMVNAVVTTEIVIDFATKTKHLVIYTLYGVDKMMREDFTDGLKALKQFARANGCTKIIAYTNIDKVIELAQILGGTVDWKVIAFAITDNVE
jgi:hypothetical protein